MTLYIILFFVAGSLYSQVSINIILVDKNKSAVPFVTVNYENSVFSSNKNGYFKIDNYKYGSKIFLKRIGFIDTVIVLKSPTNPSTILNFVLQQKIELLNEIPVYSNIVEEVNPKKMDFILDFELDGENLIQLGSIGIVNLLNKQNQLINSIKTFPQAEKIKKDPFGHINIVTPEFVYDTKIKNSIINIDTIPILRSKFDWAIQYCDDVYDSTYFIRRYKDINQTIEFFAISDKSSRLLRTVSDEERVKSVREYAQRVNRLIRILALYNETNLAGVMGDLTSDELDMIRKSERMTWTQEQLYSLPSYNILKMINDSIYIFAHDIDTLFVYDKTFKSIKGIYIDYHHLKSWGKELIVNQEKTKVFALLKTNENVMIAEINLINGMLKPPFLKIESFFPPKKIKIRGNQIYFMTKQHDGIGYTVYSQHL